jgi:hypothetical protein
MSIGADVARYPVQCLMCRGWHPDEHLRQVVCMAEGECPQLGTVCVWCFNKLRRHGSVIVMIEGKPWNISEPEARRVG